MKKQTESFIIMVRSIFILFFVFIFLLMQTMPVLAAFDGGTNAFVVAGQGSGYSKKCCCCCNHLSCPCDMRKDTKDTSIDFNLAFPARAGIHTPEDMGPAIEYIKHNNPAETTLSVYWVFARAPCPIIYLATLNLLC